MITVTQMAHSLRADVKEAGKALLRNRDSAERVAIPELLTLLPLDAALYALSYDAGSETRDILSQFHAALIERMLRAVRSLSVNGADLAAAAASNGGDPQNNAFRERANRLAAIAGALEHVAMGMACGNAGDALTCYHLVVGRITGATGDEFIAACRSVDTSLAEVLTAIAEGASPSTH